MDHPHSQVVANSVSRMLNHFHMRSINSFVDIYLSPSYFLYPFSLRLCPTEYLRLSKGNLQMGSGKPQKIHGTEYVVDTGTRPLSIYNQSPSFTPLEGGGEAASQPQSNSIHCRIHVDKTLAHRSWK